MRPTKSRINSNVLAQLAQKAQHYDGSGDTTITNTWLLKQMRHWGVLLLGTAWVALVLAAAVFLLLLFFRINYTAEWLIAAVRLAGLSFAAIGLYTITDGTTRVVRRHQGGVKTLLTGLVMLLATLSAAVLLGQAGGNHVHPLINLSAAGVWSLCLIGWSVYRLVTERQTPHVLRIAFFVAMGSIATNMIISTLGLERAYFELASATADTLYRIASVLGPVGWMALMISYIGLSTPGYQQWTGRTTLLVSLIMMVLISMWLLL